MKPMTQEWVEKTEGDFRVAAVQRLSADPVYDAICFHSQQCAEKYLKAWLVEQGLSFPRIHDLEALARLCFPSLPELTGLLDALRLLTSFAVEIRYPGTSARADDAERCWQAVESVRTMVTRRLGAGIA